MHEEGLGISSFGVDQPKIWVSVVVTPAGTGIELALEHDHFSAAIHRITAF